jgi:uncharacterized protein (TIGR02246 family)
MESPEGRAIRRVIDDFIAAFSRGDVEAIRPLFAPNAKVYPSNDRDRVGWEDIAAYWAPPFSTLHIALSVDLVDLTIDRDLAVVEMVTDARVRPRGGGEEVRRRYRDMVVLIRRGPEWRIYRNLSQAHPEPGNG